RISVFRCSDRNRWRLALHLPRRSTTNSALCDRAMHDVSSDLGRLAAAGAIDGHRIAAGETARRDASSPVVNPPTRESVANSFQAIRAVRLLHLVSSHERSIMHSAGEF